MNTDRLEQFLDEANKATYANKSASKVVMDYLLWYNTRKLHNTLNNTPPCVTI